MEGFKEGKSSPPVSVEKHNLLFLSVWQDSEQLWKKNFYTFLKKCGNCFEI